MADIYIKFGGDISGESTDKAHADWCELEGFSQSASQPVSASSGTGGRTCAGVQVGDIVLTKMIDKASPDLFSAVCKGTHLDKVEVECILSAGDSRHVYLKYLLEDVIISGYSISGNPGQKAMENLSLNVGKITVSYTPIDQKGGAGAEVSRGWDCETNEAI
jgi:type VI secretion system Hcp family effector